jgi:hypothetical protein
MKTETTVKTEIRAILRTPSGPALSKDEKLFLSGALFALEWLLGQKSKAPSKYLPWLKVQAVTGHFKPVSILKEMLNAD